MKRDDIQILREIQREAENGMRAIELLTDKVYDDELAMQLSRQSFQYAQLKNRAVGQLLKGHVQPAVQSRVEGMLQAGELRRDTLLDTSTSRVAELMIQQENKGISRLYRSLNKYDNAGSLSTEIAGEFVSFEEESIRQLRKYL